MVKKEYKPARIPQDIWEVVKTYSQNYHVDPLLIYAIGRHETDWGRLGAGRKGYFLGVGVPSFGPPIEKFKGLHNQLNWAVPRIFKYIGSDVNLGKLIHFAQTVWKPDNPSNWAKSVWRIYLYHKKRRAMLEEERSDA